MKRIIGLYIAWLIAAVMLVSAATGRHPYSFYTLLRWICCPIFAYSAFAAYEKNWVLWVWFFGVLAAMYNPIFRVHLDRSTWIGVNWFTVGVIVVAAAVFWRKEPPDVLRPLNSDILLLQEVRDYDACVRLAEAIRPHTYQVAICSAFKGGETAGSDSWQRARTSGMGRAVEINGGRGPAERLRLCMVQDR